MDLRVEHVAGAAIARPVGRIDGVTAPQVQSSLVALVESASKVVMDCTAVAYVSSAGLRAVLVAAKAAKASGTAFSLCSVDETLREIFMVSGFDAIIDLHDGVEAALA
jgi:anti-sigma B factor antagonist